MASADLIAAAAQTAPLDERGVRDFVEAHWDLVYRSAYFICADRWVAEDIAQEAMLKALRALPTLDRSRPISPWLSTIAANAAKDWLRMRARRPEETLGEQVADARKSGEDLAEDLGRNTLSDELAAGLLELKLGFRSVIVMRHLLDLSVPEIADVLDIEPTTVRTRLHRGLSQLRTMLEQKEANHD